MDKDIRFTGYTAVPSDYECTDGELTQCHNLINEDGAFHSLLAPQTVLTLDSEHHVVFIHATRMYKHFIVMSTYDSGNIASLGYIDSEDEEHKLIEIKGMPESQKRVSMEAVGNILMLSTEQDIHYYYFKETEYIYLGTSIPDLDLRFALRGELTYKRYENNLITVAQASVNDTGDYAAIGRITWVARYNQHVKNYLDSSVKIDSGKKYKFSQAVLSRQTYAAQAITFQLWGTETSSGEEKLIKETTGYSTSFTADADYTNLYFIGEHRLSQITYSSGTVVLYVGENTTTGELNYVITYDEDGYNSVMAAMNKFVNKEAAEKGKFIYPFFIRYGLRMYDGTIVNISAPILLIPNSGYVPFVHYGRSDKSLNMYAVVASLQYSIANEVPKEWRDLITGVVIYASQPIYSYNQGEAFDNYTNKFKFRFYNSNSSLYGLSSSYCLLERDEIPLHDTYSKFDLVWELREHFDWGNTTESSEYGVVQIAPREEKEILNDVIYNANFYKIKEFTLGELSDLDKDTFLDIELDKDTLLSLVTRESLDNSIIPYKRFANAKFHSYNNRSHVYDANAYLPQPTMFYSQNSYTAPSDEDMEIEGGRDFHIFVYVHSNEGDRVMYHKEHGCSETFWNLRWFFYPDPNAYKVVIFPESTYIDDPTVPAAFFNTIELSLVSHDFLNGAYYYSGGFDNSIAGVSSELQGKEGMEQITLSDMLHKNNVIYVSEANNPFAFTTVSTVSVGTTQIKGLASAARALSEGQFGDFPLYAFCANGVWALRLSSVGSYEARQPITRDVCTSLDSITQIDNTVLFATDRGIMEISGSQTSCITDLINGDDFFSLERLPGLSKLYPDGIPQIDCTFAEYRKDARMAYDYINQRIIVFNSTKNYAYVYSMKSKFWGITSSSLLTAINSYPDAYAMAKIGTDNCLVDLSRSTETHAKGLLVTRPIKLEVGSMLKTFDTVFMRGLFAKGKVMVVLYGSRDNINWHLIHSAKEHYLRGFRGTPYKYFRIVAITDLSIGETLLGASVQYTPRLTNQMR